MEKIPTSLIGYKKSAVDQILKQQENLIGTQKKDISYLRSEVSRLQKKVDKNEESERER